MSRKLNLHLPTSNEFLMHVPSFEKNLNLTARPASACSSLLSIKEKLDKTCENFHGFNDLISPPAFSSPEEDASKEIQALRTKIAQLEKEKITALISRTSTESQAPDKSRVNLKAQKIKASIDEEIKANEDWEKSWQRLMQNDRNFSQKLKNGEYASLLLKTLQFINEITDDSESYLTSKTFCEKSRLSLPGNAGRRSTKASTSAIGTSRSDSMEWSFA